MAHRCFPSGCGADKFAGPLPGTGTLSPPPCWIPDSKGETCCKTPWHFPPEAVPVLRSPTGVLHFDLQQGKSQGIRGLHPAVHRKGIPFHPKQFHAHAGPAPGFRICTQPIYPSISISQYWGHWPWVQAAACHSTPACPRTSRYRKMWHNRYFSVRCQIHWPRSGQQIHRFCQSHTLWRPSMWHSVPCPQTGCCTPSSYCHRKNRIV